VRYCWLLTAAGEGDIRPRPMGRVPRDADEDSVRKVLQIRLSADL
jgi:hypothetical protein